MLSRPVSRLSAVLLAVSCAASAWSEGAPPPQQIQLSPSMGKTMTTIKLVALDASGAISAAGQQVLDQMSADGWRAGSMSTVSLPGANAPSLAVLYTKPIPPPQQGQPGNPPPMPPGAPHPMPPGPPQGAPMPAPAQAPHPAPPQPAQP
jgi:hypothetical protein